MDFLFVYCRPELLIQLLRELYLYCSYLGLALGIVQGQRSFSYLKRLACLSESLERTASYDKMLTFFCQKIMIIRHGLMLLWFKDLINVTEKLQFIDPMSGHSCLVPSSGVVQSLQPEVLIFCSYQITLDEGTRLECQNDESMNCNFSVTFIKSLNQSSIKPCPVVHLFAL